MATQTSDRSPLPVPHAMIAEGRNLLVAHGWLSRADPGFRSTLLDLCRWRRLHNGDVIARADSDEADIYGIAAGCAAATHVYGGLDSDFIHVWHSGDWLGEVPLVSGGRRRGTCVARGDVLLATVPAADLRRFLAEQPLGWREIARLCELHSLSYAVAGLDLTRRDPLQRCVAALLRLAGARFGPAPDGPPTLAPVTQQELAEVCNLSRNAVSRLLQPLEEGGQLHLGYRVIELHDPQALRAMLAG